MGGSERGGAASRGSRWGCRIAAGVLVTAVLGGCGQGQATEQFTPEVLQGPGTPLPGGLVVLPGSHLLGAALEYSDGSRWQAVLQLDEEPVSVYDQYLIALKSSSLPKRHAGCESSDDETGKTRCQRTVRDPSDRRALVTIDMLSLDDDVTGHYLLVLQRGPGEFSGETIYPKESLKADEPYSPAGPFKVGEALPGRPSAHGGPYELLEGSELIAVYGKGSAYGGFDLLLHIAGGADVSVVAAAYARQASQVPGVTTSSYARTNASGTAFSNLNPPGSADGWQATLNVVDNPGRDQDYLYYSLYHDD